MQTQTQTTGVTTIALLVLRTGELKMPSLVTEEMQLQEKSKMADGGHIFWQTGTKFRLSHNGNIPDKF